MRHLLGKERIPGDVTAEVRAVAIRKHSQSFWKSAAQATVGRSKGTHRERERETERERERDGEREKP